MAHGRRAAGVLTAAGAVSEHGQALRPWRRAPADGPRAQVPGDTRGPYRDHLRTRRADDPTVPVQQMLAEIRELGYTGSMNLLYHYTT
jgi:hypothetical protein